MVMVWRFLAPDRTNGGGESSEPMEWRTIIHDVPIPNDGVRHHSNGIWNVVKFGWCAVQIGRTDGLTNGQTAEWMNGRIGYGVRLKGAATNFSGRTK